MYILNRHTSYLYNRRTSNIEVVLKMVSWNRLSNFLFTLYTSILSDFYRMTLTVIFCSDFVDLKLTI